MGLGGVNKRSVVLKESQIKWGGSRKPTKDLLSLIAPALVDIPESGDSKFIWIPQYRHKCTQKEFFESLTFQFQGYPVEKWHFFDS